MFLKRQNKIKNSVAEDEKNIWKELADAWGLSADGIRSGALNSITYFACMQIRCNAVAKIPIKIMKFVGDSADVDPTHPLYRLLKLRPNPNMTPHDLLWMTEFQRLHYGNAYWVKTIKNGKISGIYPLDSSRVTVWYDDGGIIDDSGRVFYTYDISTKTKTDRLYYTSDDIVHFKNFSQNGIVGKPMTHYITEIIDSEKYGRNVIKQKSKDGLQDPIILQYTGDLNKEKEKQMINRFKSLGGSKNAGKVIPLPPQYSVAQLETKLVNSQFFELQGLNSQQIANAFGVKSFQLNDLEKSTYNNVQAQNESFYIDTMQNVYTQYEQEIDYKLFFEKEIASGYYSKFNVDAMLRSDILKRYQAYQVGISSGFLKISEARKKEDLNFEKGTDKLIIGNGASIPLSELGKQYTKGGE